MKDQKILETTYRLFEQRGVRAFCLYDVAMDCGIKVKELSTRFSSKKKLVLATVNHLLAKNTSYLKVNPTLSPSAIKELENLFLYAEKKMNWFHPRMVFELKKYHREAWGNVVSFTDQKLRPYLRTNLERGISEGCYRTDIDAELFVNCYFNIIKSIYDDIGEDREVVKIIHQLHSVLLKGITRL